ncbi:hypothetical protein SSX86_007363 [Deinandra increscens subsp. villosa]|uniref:Uncharacterized protein n=1 Tax=Deinandra increscens subsp. villosa TaxID=3103831 RepID=A0AAP0DEK6_9ASTR
MLEQFHWESENRPDYRHTPEVERILNEDPIFEKKENPTREEIEENERWLKGFRESPVVKFLARVEEVLDEINEMELKENSEPYRWEDKKYWKSIPNVIGPDGRPMPRKAIRTKKESDDKFWDFAKQFFFGLWGFRQRPYPPGRPIDVAQAVGYKRLEKRYYDSEEKTECRLGGGEPEDIGGPEDLNEEKLGEKKDVAADKDPKGGSTTSKVLKPDDYSERVFFLNNN